MVNVYNADGHVGRLSVVSQGGEMWTARATASRLNAEGAMSLVVTGTDVSARVERGKGRKRRSVQGDGRCDQVHA